MIKFIIRSLNILFGIVLFLIIIGLIILYEYTKNLPSYDEIINYKPNLSINIFDENGEYMGAIFKENRIFITSDNIPPLIKGAIISAEDKDFYSNSGIDLSGIIRSIFINIYNKFSGEKKLVGGSTITQQIIKNILLSSEKSIKRKIQEARLALGITKYLNKEQILERYINHIYLGNNTYGFAAAAIGYFGKNLDELSIEESAVLAALPQAPSRYDPVKKENQSALLFRRNWILGQMEKMHYITKSEYEKAIIEPIKLNRTNLVTQQKKQLGSEYVIDEIKKKISTLYVENPDQMYQEGLLVKSTIDTRLQEIATFALRKGLLEYEKNHYNWKGPIDNFKTFEEYKKFLKNFNHTDIYPLKTAYVFKKDTKNSIIYLYHKSNDEYIEIKETNQKIFKNTNIGDVVLIFNDIDSQIYNIYQKPRLNGAIGAIDIRSGGVLAMSGGFNYYSNQYNRATQANRQPGSAFKPLVYLAGLESGMTPSTTVFDEPISLPAGNGKWWTPKNYDGNFYGAMSMTEALARSRNLCTLYIARSVGLKKIIETCKHLKLFPNDYKLNNYSIILGAQETTLFDMLRVYGIIANGGFDIEYNIIDYIKDISGSIIWKNGSAECSKCNIDISKVQEDEFIIENSNVMPPIIKENKERLINKKVDYDLLSMMKNVVKRGTASSLSYLGGNIAGKTGTSNDAKDIWFLGMTNKISFGIYIGFDQPKSIGNRAYGANVAIPIMKYFLDLAKKENLLGHEDEFEIITEFENNNANNNDYDEKSNDSYYVDEKTKESLILNKENNETNNEIEIIDESPKSNDILNDNKEDLNNNNDIKTNHEDLNNNNDIKTNHEDLKTDKKKVYDDKIDDFEIIYDDSLWFMYLYFISNKVFKTLLQFNKIKLI